MPFPPALGSPVRRYAKTAVLAATSAIGDSPLFLVDYVLRLLRVLVLLSLWRTILGQHGATSGYTLQAVLTYTLISAVFAEQLACRSSLMRPSASTLRRQRQGCQPEAVHLWQRFQMRRRVASPESRGPASLPWSGRRSGPHHPIGT